MADFMSMSGVFDRAGEAMLPDMAEKLGVPVDLVPRMVQDTSMNYLFGADMATERADTWRRALALGAEHPGDVGPYGRDAAGHITGDTTQSDQMSAIGGLSDPSLRPSMTEPMNSGDDDSAHADLAGHDRRARSRALPAVRRVQYLRALQSGATIGDDETLVLRILAPRRADLVPVVDGADAWDLMYALDDGQRGEPAPDPHGRSYYDATARQHGAAPGAPLHGRRDGGVGGGDGRRHRRRARRPRRADPRDRARVSRTMNGSDDFREGPQQARVAARRRSTRPAMQTVCAATPPLPRARAASGGDAAALGRSRDGARNVGTRSATSASVSGKWQAAMLPPSLTSSGGSSVRQISCAFQQRVWKRQACGGLVGDGTSPASTWRFFCAASRGSATGTADISAPV